MNLYVDCYFFYEWIVVVLFLNKVHMGNKLAHTWFLKITLVHTLVYVLCMYRPPRTLIISDMTCSSYIPVLVKYLTYYLKPRMQVITKVLYECAGV